MDKNNKKKKVSVRNNDLRPFNDPSESVSSEQKKGKSLTDPYQGDDKHGPMEDESVVEND
jgi:hypothetical protein